VSLTTQSRVNSRIYHRKFDHDECRRLRNDEKWTYRQLAEHFAVSDAAIRRVCDPAARERMDARTSQFLWDHREPCKGGCGALVWAHIRGRTGLCPRCDGVRRAADGVRPDTLLCRKCDEWKPDAKFGLKGPHGRRGCRSTCRECESKTRAEHRRLNSDATHAYDRERKNRLRGVETVPQEFIVLRQNGDGGWKEHARVEAATSLQAIEQCAQQEGRFVAFSDKQIREVEAVQKFAIRRPVGATSA
jgi:hypothetical protein